MRFLVWIAMVLAATEYASGQSAEVHLQIPNMELLNQDGQQIKFVSDVIKDRIAVINTVFTTCTTICPVMGANYARLAKILKDRVGHDVVMVSVSVDPVNDTPGELKSWSAKFYKGPGWILLTGPKLQVDALLKSMGLYTPERQDHQSSILIGNQTSGWVRASALASPEKWVKIIDSFGTAKSQTIKLEKTAQ